MTESYQNKAKNQYVIEAATKFTENLFNHFKNIKIGVVGFSSENYTTTYREGTLNDAKLLLSLSNSKDDVLASINSYTEMVALVPILRLDLALLNQALVIALNLKNILF